jgi:hypothetical protein
MSKLNTIFTIAYLRLLNSILLVWLCACQTDIKHPDGGYPYPEKFDSAATRYYSYALKDKTDRRDSFWNAFEYLYFEAFNEANLSIKPMPDEVFRLYFEGFRSFPVCIILSDQKIIVKKGNRSYFFEDTEDTTRFSPVETQHFFLLNRRFPFEEYKLRKRAHPKVVSYIDSMVNLYPQLLDTEYHFELVRKALNPGKEPFTYTTKTIPLTKTDYNDLISAIDSSGFWNLPYKLKCVDAGDLADGHYVLLESNTKYKYNRVGARSCPNDTSKFIKACQKLVDYAQMNKDIDLIWIEK